MILEYYIIGGVVLSFLILIFLLIKLFSKFTRSMFQMLTLCSKLIRDLEKFKQSLQDEIIAVSKTGDSLKSTLQIFKQLEKISNNFNNNILALNRCVEQYKSNNGGSVTHINKIVEDLKQLKNKG